MKVPNIVTSITAKYSPKKPTEKQDPNKNNDIMFIMQSTNIFPSKSTKVD